MMDSNISKTGIILATIALIGTLASALTYNVTEETIENNKEQAALGLFAQVLPGIAYNNDIINDKVDVVDEQYLGTSNPQAIHIARLNGQPVGVIINTVAPNGYNGAINILVGMSADKTVTGVRVVKHRETPGLGDGIEARKSDWILAFAGKSLANLPFSKWKVKKDGGAFDQMTGATITPRAVVGAVVKAQQFFAEQQGALFKAQSKTKHEGEK